MSTMTNPGSTQPTRIAARPSQALDCVREALDGLRYGEVLVKVQDGVVVQVERTERVRVKEPGPPVDSKQPALTPTRQREA